MQQLLSRKMFCLLSLMLLVTGSTAANEYYVVSSKDGSADCPIDYFPCNNLTYYLNDVDTYFTNDTILYFLNGAHLLEEQELIMITDISNLTLKGIGASYIQSSFHETAMESTVQIVCTRESGLSFKECSNITISGITFSECGGVSQESELFYSQTYSSLVFDTVINVTLEQVSVLNGTGIGLLMENTYDISIRDSSFSLNRIPPCEDLLCPGGNLYIGFYGTANNYSNIDIKIIRSNFSLGYSTEYGAGGGVTVFVNLNHLHVNVNLLMDGLVIHGNTGLLAPNIHIELSCTYGVSYTIKINNTISTYGNGLEKPPQAILDVLQINAGNFYFMDKSENHQSANLGIYNSEFSNGDVYNYGGLQISWLAEISDILKATMEDCVIRNNTGDGGSAMYLFAARPLESTLPNFNLKNILIESNRLNVGNDPLFGGVLVQNFNMTVSNLWVIGNKATGLISLASLLTFTGLYSKFENNFGVFGGGVALYESSYLILKEPVFIEFLNNTAEKGGGIFVSEVNYASDSCFLTSSCSIRLSCFYQLPDISTRSGNTLVYFSNNKAITAGSVLYGGNIDQCKSDLNFDRDFNYTEQIGMSVISSDPVSVCYCINETENCLRYKYRVSVAPGETFIIPIAAVGQRDGITPGVLQITDYTTTPPTKTLNTLTSTCTDVKYTIRVTNSNQSSLQLYLTLEGVTNPINNIQGNLLYVSIMSCPPGFSLQASTGLCVCEAILRDVIGVKCNVTTQLMSREGRVWMGYNNLSNCTIVREDCPFDYCVASSISFRVTRPDPQCALNRSGILCGQCAEGLSLMLGTNKCGECTNDYIALIIPFALAGIALVAFLIVLNLTVSVGTINGLIFYANIVKINEGIFFPNGPIPVLSQFISWINLELGIEICFFNGMTALDKAWLHYIFPIYIWIIIAALIVLAHCSAKFAKLMGNNAVPILATLLLLSYAKIFRAVVNVINGTYLTCGSKTTTVWYIDATVNYFNASHIILVVISGIFLLALTLPYTLVVLLNHPLGLLLNSNKLRACGFHRTKLGIRLFLQCYNTPFKKRFVFWTGLLLLIRFVLVFVVAFSDNVSHSTAIISLVAIPLAIMAGFGGVYEKWQLDVLEAWFMFNIIFVASFTDLDKRRIATIVSTTLTLLTCIGIVIYHIAIRVHKIKKIDQCFKKIGDYFATRKSVSAKDPAENSAIDLQRPRTVTSVSIEMMRRETLLTNSSEDIIIRNHKST